MLTLTPRQVEVCVLAGGFGFWMSDKAIGRELGITVHTVQKHMADGAEKIRASNPAIGNGSPRVVCQAWVRQAYHVMSVRAMGRAA
jgi:DNA-binding NarL/FixJ family response regulator